MPRHHETRRVPYSAAQFYAMVADMGRYPEFLPWIQRITTLSGEGDSVQAEVVIGFKIITESYRCRVTFNKNKRIDVNYLAGPFTHLENHWIFKDVPGGGCEVEFFLDFDLKTRLFQNVMKPLFAEATRRMVQGFEDRARQLYG